VPSGRRSAVVVVVLATALTVALIGPATVLAKDPPGLKRFMDAVGKVESGGNYHARNRHSGAYGKYQIMPSNWPSWARRYLGDAHAPQSPVNQEKVVAGKFRDLYRGLHSWRRVAYWWLTGSSRRSGWSSYATRYVHKVMHYYKVGVGAAATHPASAKHYSESSASIAYTGTWRPASHRAYQGDRVKYATGAGATATFTFTGRRVTWYGPTGPTRGKAKVYIDGTYVRTVDLHRGSFSARTVAFRTAWQTVGPHTLTIKVVGGGHPMVAIDEFVVSK
jgi:hypothetical protein